MIEFKSVKLNIKNIDILNDISFSINKNTATCFAGNKNTGKSSILKLIAGIYKQYNGEILIDGKNIKEAKKIKIGFVSQQRENDTNLTVYEYLKFYGSIYNIASDEINKLIDESLKKFSLMSYKFTGLELLDNENYKLLDIIRVMICDPDIILFDNLFFSDNIDYNEKLHEFVQELKGKKTLIFASRNLNHIEDICENIGILDHGELIAFGNKEEIYRITELGNKIEVKINSGLQEALNCLKSQKNITNIVYDDNSITFSIYGENQLSQTKKNELENIVLKKLIDNNVSVYSFKKERVRFEQLFGKLKE